jgi:putative endonuclease
MESFEEDMTIKSNYTYILLCSDNTLYTGWTNHLEARVLAHNLGAGAKYTKMRLPVKLVYSEAFDTKSEALKREIEIKKLSRKKKLALIGD